MDECAVGSYDKYTQIQQDVIDRVINTIPTEVLNSFDHKQLAAIKKSVAINSGYNDHYVDFRPVIGIGRWRYYAVFLLGKDRRKAPRHQMTITTIIKAIHIVFGLCVIFTSAVLVLYLIKSALGIDIFKHFSFGIWDYFKLHFLQ
ncbi:3-phosphoshikimate 1-carboxyvinyltransferase [Photobacterium carnosum]|jgi:hypothetical protein|uniref:3-phosphoshikimate 1-carboxyvinyltransferase n=1 Tax=Photobacterium carnosum TaxID=2023717 RepID=A0A2N4UUT6_9GAMM|nr:3-phosphoshikimate 1-carboxyvinyltransferase [Photobacterium carnosum]MCD9536192.1 3-phosphoshikimate 1-carboxyvinyltransferase [Photobacterium carnosum]MCD9552162.1 3-phosphoshikimate 1-carboxyvinyltransferase [Photobacterium carnosum]MCF2160580.1 3-phosphoshikimate 1-carboxyvinyltransferase [Photobacterium carnosum]PLC58780.1 hypothetical protein CIK00_05145 [Photobacterium carnosum]